MLVLVTGATSGIGKSAAELFAKNGYDLIITGRRKDRLDAVSKELKTTYNINVLGLNFDVRNFTEVEKAMKSLPSEFSKIDILVNNAGLAAGLSSIQNGDLSHWERMIDTNIKGLLYMTREVCKG